MITQNKNKMKKILFALLILQMALGAYAWGQSLEKVITFKFVPGDDMFYIPWESNDAQLNALYALVDEYRTEITAGRMPVYVDGYASSMRDNARNRELAFIRSNRVKSELITQKGLAEENFVTKNYTTAFTDADGTIHKDMVVVTLRIPAKAEEPKPAPKPEPKPQIQESSPEPEPEPVVIPEPEPIVVEDPVVRYSRWSIGANVGMPFFWGDMTSLSADKTYFGISAGVQATYQISPAFGVTLSFDWTQNKAGSRGYAKDYLLDASGMTWYTPQSFTTKAYGDLYSKINMYSAGLHVDINVTHFFGPKVANGRLKLVVSPAAYAQHFSSKIYTKSDDAVFVGERLSKDISLGLGGDVALRYAVSPLFDVQIKGTGIWITDNLFDNIRTVGHVKQNAMWGVSAGVVWKIGGNRNTNLMYKNK